MPDNFTYERTWAEIHDMLDKAEREKNRHSINMGDKKLDTKTRMFHARNFKALEGVCKTLRWVLGDVRVDHPLE